MTKQRNASDFDGDRTYACWLIEAAWGRDVPRYLSTTGGSGGWFFEWREEPHRALKFADWDSANAVREAVREKCRELFPTVVPHPAITEHIFIGDGGAQHDSKHLEATTRTQ